MLAFIHAMLLSYAALFPIINPMGAAIIFLDLVEGSSPQEINALAYKVAIYVVILLLVVLVIGSLILNIFGITVPIILISGGILLFHVGWQILCKSSSETSSQPSHLDKHILHVKNMQEKNALSINITRDGRPHLYCDYYCYWCSWYSKWF